MSRGKRARLAGDDDDEDSEETVEVIQSASSALRATNKRPRIASSPMLGSGSLGFTSRASSQGFEEHELQSTQFQRHATGFVDEYQRERDRSSVAPSEADELMQEQVTQQLARQRAGAASSQAAECGILERVIITNFMCHTKLEVPLGPTINFIIGHNGSGKSAVLTAVTLCLGGKTAATNRGGSLKDLIKQGCDQAVLEVRIKNQGAGAYKHDVYGDSIIVERHFDIRGTSSFKIKSANNRLISSKKGELDSIIDYYAFQLDNPVNVLTQDNARQFIGGSTDKDKYALFVKGVQLEQLDSDYTLLGERLDGIDGNFEQLVESGKRYSAAYNEAKERYKHMEQFNNTNAKLNSLRRQIAWKQVEEKEDELAAEQERVTQAERQLARAEREYEQKSSEYSEADQAHQEAIERAGRVENEEGPLKHGFDSAKASFDAAKDTIMKLNHDQRGLDSELKAHQTRLNHAEQKVSEEYNRLQEAGGENEAAKVREIRDTEAELESAKTALDEHKERLPGLTQEEKQARDDYNRASKQLYAKEKDLKTAQERVHELRNSNRRDEWAGYLPNMKTLVDAIARETRFQRKPVGPFGKHVRLLKPDWSSILESYMGNALNGFAVTTKADQSLLADIMRRCRCDRAPVFFGSEAPLSNVREPNGFNTVMKVLEIDNELVRKHLIINQIIDQTVIMDSVRQVMDLMRGAHQFPENVKSVLTKHATQIGFGYRYTFSAAGSQVSSPIAKFRGSPRMVMDDREAIRVQEATVDEFKEQVVASENAKRSHERKTVECAQAIQRHKRELTTLRAEEQQIDEKLQDLKLQLEQLRPGDGQLEAFKEVVESLKGQVDHYRTQMDALKATKDKTALENASTKRAMDNAEAALTEKRAEIAKAQKRVDKYANGRQTALRYKNEADASRGDASNALEQQRSNASRAQAVLDSMEEQAQEVCQRVPIEDGATRAVLEHKHADLHRRFNDMKKSIGASPEELQKAVSESSARVKNFERVFRDNKAVRKQLVDSLWSRRDRWRKFRTAISVRARANFMTLLAERRFRGNMVIDHRSRQLQLLVEPDPSRKARSAGSKTTALSGGERSFTTLCMLLALWDAMGSPIRCLDEFDVYMDAANRDMSMKMLIEAAKTSVGRQYIFITPQAMNNAEADPSVKCIRLEDPERGQSTLTQAGITRG